MLARAEKSVTIHRPVQSVFEFVLNGANNRLWKPGVREVRPLGDAPYGVGSRFRQDSGDPEGPGTGDYEITQLEQNKLIAMQIVEGPAGWKGRYEFQEQPEGTMVTYALSYETTQHDAALAEQALRGVQHALAEERAASAQLGPQEQRALWMRLDGRPDADIARSMFVGEGTVRNYIYSGLTKLAIPRIQRWMDDEVGTLDELKAFLEKIA